MTKAHSELHLTAGAMRLADAIAAGHSRDALRRDVDAGRLQRPFRGVLSEPAVQADIDVLRAAMLHVGPESWAILGSAALLHGLLGVPAGAVPQIAVPPGLEKRQRAGIDLHFWDVTDDDLTVVDALATTRPRRTLADACRLLPRWRAVSLVDSALNTGLVTIGELDAIASLMARRRHCVTGRAVLRLSRLGAESPLETRVRLIATDAGLPPDEIQVPVHDRDGALLGYGDLGYRLPRGHLLVVEADGAAVHSLPDALLHDRRRQNAFVGVPGLTVVRFAWDDTRNRVYIPSVLRPLLDAAGWRPPRRA